MSIAFLVATSNSHKITEFRRLAVSSGLCSSSDVDERITGAGALDVPETGVTFEENALAKARAYAKHTGGPCLADDSGLIVDVFGNAPGVWSARWAGDRASDAANRELVLQQLRDVPTEHRGARFECVLAYVDGGREFTARGVCRGFVAADAVGQSGFGYDPIFVPEGYSDSFSVLGSSVKDALSHRSRAWDNAVSSWLRKISTSEV